MSNPFWDFSLSNYRRDGVAQTCLTLQDEFGLDVNVLLYGGWLAAMDQCLTEDHLAGIAATIAPWRERVVLPLRILRRQWRDYPAAIDLRDEVKALELQAERQQQDMMLAFYAVAGKLPTARRPIAPNLIVVASVSCPETDRWVLGIDQLCAKLQP